MRLLWISGIDGFCHRYEVLHRAAQARLFGARSVVRHFTDARLEHDVARADVVLAYRTPETPLVRAVLAAARRRGVPVLGTIDDLIFVPDAGSLPSLEHLGADERALWLDGVRRYRAVLDACDGFLAPTEPLLATARDLGWRAWLHRDALSSVELALGDRARRRESERRTSSTAATEVLLGYFSGTPTHDRDFATIAPALAEVLAAHPSTSLLLVGPLVIAPALESFAARIRRMPRVPWTELPALIATVDVNLAPLELDSRFACAKGEVKYLEAAAVGVPTVASPTPAFRHAIRDGENGRLAFGLEQWRAALEDLVIEPARRRTLGLAARADVAERFAPPLRARELETILAEAVRLSDVPPASGPALHAGHERARVALEPDARPELDHPPGPAVAPPLGAGARLVQTFRVGAREVQRIDLFPLTYGQRLAHHVHLRIVDAGGRTVLRRRRRAAYAPDGAWWSFVVPRRRLVRDHGYRIELTVAEPRIDAALSFALAAGPSRALAPAEHDGASLGAALALRTFGAWDLDAGDRGHGEPLSGSSRAPRLLDRATTLTGAILARADADGARARLVFAARDGSEQRFSVRALLARAAIIRAGLEAHGLHAGNAIVLILPTGPELVAAYFAVLLAGGVPALASTPTQRVAAAEAYCELIGGILRDAGARLAYCDDGAAAVLAPDGAALFGATRIVRPEDLRTPPGQRAPVACTSEAVATIQYSSGSTGAPKGVRLSHRAILNNLRAVRDALALTPRDVSVNWIPLYHDMGLIDAFLLPLLCGCETVLIPTGDFIRAPHLWLQALDRYQGTISWAPNFAYALCVQRVDERDLVGLDLSRWRLAMNAAEPVLAETIAAFAARFAGYGLRPEAMTPAWGLAENVTIATTHPPARPPRVERIDRGAAASVARAVPATDADAGFPCVAIGRPLPGCVVQIRDRDTVLGERAIGDIWLGSDSLFSRYGDEPTGHRTESPERRWLTTGDRGYLADGDLFFVARTKDVIVIAGEKYAPHDVETAINEVPGVRPGCAVAFGTIDARRGTEVVSAVVETRLTDPVAQENLARAIRSHVTRVTGLALRHLKLVPPGGVGKTTSGKLARGATRARYLAELA